MDTDSLSSNTFDSTLNDSGNIFILQSAPDEKKEKKLRTFGHNYETLIIWHITDEIQNISDTIKKRD